jgi:hypothetical protein
MEYSKEKNELTSKVVIISLVISILYIPLIIVGQTIGGLFAAFIYSTWLYDGVRDSFMPEIITNIILQAGPIFLACGFGGVIAGIVSVKIYKLLNVYIALIIPSVSTLLLTLFMLYFLMNIEFSAERIYNIIGNIISVYAYYFTITNEQQNISRTEAAGDF